MLLLLATSIAKAQTVTSIAISSTLPNVYRGQTATLSCIAQLSTGGTEVCPSPIYTESSGGSVLSLSGATITGYAFGSSTITATASSQTATLTINDVPPPQEPLGIVTSTQMAQGLGFNVTPDNDWEFALAKHSGATQVRFQCGWEQVEQQSAPPNNVPASPQYVLGSECTSGLTSAKNYGLSVDIVAAYGPPYHQILTVTVPAGAKAGATSFSVTFVSGVGGDTLAKLTPFIDNILSSTNSQITTINSYPGGLITAVTPTSSTTATITLASALSAALPANTTATYIINEGLYPPAANWSTTNASIIAYTNYAQYLAQQISVAGVIGEVEIWNEPPWFGDQWDNILNYYDTQPGPYSPGPLGGGLPNFGFVARLQTMTAPAGVTYNWGGTEKSGSNTLISSSSLMLSNTGSTFIEPATSVAEESLHPYGNNPEDNLWVGTWLATTTGNNDYYSANFFGVGPNFSYATQMSMLARQSNPAYGIPDNVSETGFSTEFSDVTHQARFALRQFLALEMAGVTPVNFYRLYDNTGYGMSFTDPSTEAPLQSLTAIAGLQSDISLIGYAPVAAYSSATLTQVSSWANTTGFPLDVAHIVGSTPGSTSNSELMILYQRSYTTGGAPWYNLAQPISAPVTVTMPNGMALISAINLTTRGAVATTVSGQNVTLSVSDDPVELLVESTRATQPIFLSGSTYISGSASLSQLAIGAVTYAPTDTCDNTGSSTSTSCTTSGSVTAGDALVIAAAGSIAFTSAVDSLGGTITQFTGFPVAWGSGYEWQIYCMPNAAAGQHTITLSGPANDSPAIFVMGFHGASTTTPCTPNTTASTTTNTGITAGSSVTTTVANSAVVGLSLYLTDSITAASGYTQVVSPNIGFGAEYLLAPTAGSFAPAFTLSSSAVWVETALVVNP